MPDIKGRDYLGSICILESQMDKESYGPLLNTPAKIFEAYYLPDMQATALQDLRMTCEEIAKALREAGY